MEVRRLFSVEMDGNGSDSMNEMLECLASVSKESIKYVALLRELLCRLGSIELAQELGSIKYSYILSYLMNFDIFLLERNVYRIFRTKLH